MKRKKRYSLFVGCLAAVMLFSAVGCGNQEDIIITTRAPLTTQEETSKETESLTETEMESTTLEESEVEETESEKKTTEEETTVEETETSESETEMRTESESESESETEIETESESEMTTETEPATEPETDAKYTVEHYLETVDGEYKLEEDATEEKTGEIDSTATATPKEFTGFTENTTHEDRVPTGTIAEDGSLVLKLYYDRIEYKVTFDTKGGKPEPETQIKKYGEKVVEPTDPTQDGYTFTGWYYEGTDGKKYDYNFDDPVTHDVHLIAKWEPIAKEDEKEVTPKQEDKSTSPKILPNTGKTTAIALVFGVCAVAVLGKKYYNLRDINK